MRLLSINLFNFCAPHSFYYSKDNFYSQNAWSAKLAWIVEQIQTIDPDILFFQEVFSLNEIQLLCQNLGYSHFHSSEEPKFDSKSPSILRSPVVAIATKTNFPTKIIDFPTPDFIRRKPCLIQHMNEKGDKSFFLNLHLKSKRLDNSLVLDPKEILTYFPNTKKNKAFQYQNNFLFRLREFQFYHNYLKNFLNKNIIIAGDFNENYKHPIFQNLCSSSQNFELKTHCLNRSSSNFKSIQMEWFDPSLSNLSSPFEPSVDYGKLDKFDYILTNEKTTFLEGGSLNSHLQQGPSFYYKRSDHAPVWIEFSFK